MTTPPPTEKTPSSTQEHQDSHISRSGVQSHLPSVISTSELGRRFASSSSSSSSHSSPKKGIGRSICSVVTGTMHLLTKGAGEATLKVFKYGNVSPEPAILESHRHLDNTHDERLTQICRLIEAVITVGIVENPTSIEKSLAKLIEEHLTTDKGNKLLKTIMEKSKIPASQGGVYLIRNVFGYELIAQTICANVANLFANLADQSYPEDIVGDRFPDRQRNSLGRLVCTLFDLYEYKLALTVIERCENPVEREQRYDALFQTIATTLLNTAFPQHRYDLLLFHRFLPLDSLRDFAWDKLQPALAKFLKAFYLETFPLSVIDPEWQVKFDQTMGIPDAHQMVHALSFFVSTQILATHGTKIDEWLKQPLEKWFSKREFDDPILISWQVRTTIKELFLTKSSDLQSKGKFLERCLMEKLLMGLVNTLPNPPQSIAGSSTQLIENDGIPTLPNSDPFFVVKIRQLLGGQVLDQIIHALRNPGIASNEQCKSLVTTLLTLLGWNSQEKFPLPPTITKIVWKGLNEYFQVTAPEMLSKKLQWEAIQNEQSNRIWLQANIHDHRVIHAMDGIILKLNDDVFEMIKAPSTFKKIIKKLQSFIPFPLTPVQKSAIEAQWKILFVDPTSPLTTNLKTFISSLTKPLCYQLLRDMYDQYFIETAAANSLRTMHSSENSASQSRSEFNVWLMEKLIHAFDSISIEPFSEQQKAALRRAKELQELLANNSQQGIELEETDDEPALSFSSLPSHASIAPTPKEELKSQWLVVKPRFERVARSLFGIFGYTNATSLPLPLAAQKTLWKRLSEILFENGNSFIVAALDVETNQAVFAQRIEDPSAMVGFNTAIAMLGHLIGSKLTAEETLKTLKEALSTHAHQSQINSIEALWNGLFPTLIGPHPDNYLVSTIKTTFSRLLYPHLLKIVFHLYTQYLNETMPPFPRKEFTIWLIETFTTALNGLNFNQFSPDHRVVLKRAIDLKNTLRVTTDPREIERLTQALKVDWKVLKPQFKQITQATLGALGFAHQTDLPGSPSLQKTLWEAVPKILFDQMSNMILPFLEKEECLDVLRRHEHGELMIQLCRSFSTDIVSHLPEYVNSYETVVREFNATDDLPRRLNNEGQILQFVAGIATLVETKQLNAAAMYETFEAVLDAHVPYTISQKEIVFARLRILRKKIEKIVITPEKIAEHLSVLGFSPEIQVQLVQQIRRLVVEQEGSSQPIKEFIQSYVEVMLLEFCRGSIHLNQTDFEAIITSFKQTRTQLNVAQPDAVKEIINGFIDQVLTRLGVTSILHVKGLPFSLDQTILSAIKEELSKKLLGMHQLERNLTTRLGPPNQTADTQTVHASTSGHSSVASSNASHLNLPSGDEEPEDEEIDLPEEQDPPLEAAGGMEPLIEEREQPLQLVQTEFEKAVFYLLQKAIQKGRISLTTVAATDPTAPAPLVDAPVEHNLQAIENVYALFRENLSRFTRQGYQSTAVIQMIVDTGMLTPLLRRVLQDLASPENAAYPINGAKLLTPVVSEKFQRILTTLIEQEQEQGSDFHQNVLKEMLRVFNTHLKMINAASLREGGINFTNYFDAHTVDNLRTHPAVPTGAPNLENRTDQFGQRKDLFFLPLLEDVIRLFFPEGLQELKDLVKDIAPPEAFDKIFENGKISATHAIAKKFDVVFKREFLVKILNSVLESILANLRKPIVFTATAVSSANVEGAVPPADDAIPIPRPINAQLNGEVDTMIGQCITEAVQLFEVPLIKSILGISPEMKQRFFIDQLENKAYQSIGNAIRQQFQENPIRQGIEKECRKFAEKVDNNGAIIVEPAVPIAVESTLNPEQRLIQLKRELAKELVVYPFNYLGAYIRYLTTTQYPVVNATISLIVGICSFVFTKMIGNSLRQLKIDRLSEIYIEELINNIENRLSLIWTNLQINENLIYQEVETFKRVMNENRTGEPEQQHEQQPGQEI